MNKEDLKKLDRLAVSLADCVRKPILGSITLTHLKFVSDDALVAWNAYRAEYTTSREPEGLQSARAYLTASLWRFQELLYDLFAYVPGEDRKKEIWPYFVGIRTLLVLDWVLHEKNEEVAWAEACLNRSGDLNELDFAIDFEAAIAGIRLDFKNPKTASRFYELLKHLRESELTKA